jgi:hydroxypyruvate reductase
MLSLQTLRDDARAAFDAAVAAVQPQFLVPAQVETYGTEIRISGEALPEVVGRKVVFSIGKAAAGLAAAWLQAAPGWTDELFVLTPHGTPVPDEVAAGGQVLRGAHPYPDSEGERSTRVLLNVADSLGAHDCLVVLLSGGGSALMAAAEEGLSLDDVHATTKALLESGAAITEVNTVRRQLLAAAGGGLARTAAPALVQTLILSDVLGDPLADIASGPTVPSTSTAGDALGVVDRRSLRDRVPAAVIDYLEAAAGSPADDLAWSATSATRVIGNNRTAVEAAAAALGRRGYRTVVETGHLEGEASTRGRELAKRALAADVEEPTALVYGGETTVTVRGSGSGGRNQELALAAAQEIAGGRPVVVLAGGTDGIDGLSDNAGAVVDPTTIQRLAVKGIDAAGVLNTNDSGTALAAIGDAIRTGPTGTNVCDVTIVLTAPADEQRKD